MFVVALRNSWKNNFRKFQFLLAYSCRRLSQLWCTCLVWRSCDTRWSYLQRRRKKQRGTEMSRGWRNCHPHVLYERMNKSNKKKEGSKWKLEVHITSKGHTSYRTPAAPNHPKQFLQLETLHRTLEDIPNSNSSTSITLQYLTTYPCCLPYALDSLLQSS